MKLRYSLVFLSIACLCAYGFFFLPTFTTSPKKPRSEMKEQEALIAFMQAVPEEMAQHIAKYINHSAITQLILSEITPNISVFKNAHGQIDTGVFGYRTVREKKENVETLSNHIAMFAVKGAAPITTDYEMQIVELPSMESRYISSTYSDFVSITLIPNGRFLVSGAQDGTVKLLNIDSKSPMYLQHHTLIEEPDEEPDHGSVTALQFSTDGTLLAAGFQDGTIILIDFRISNIEFLKSDTPFITTSFKPHANQVKNIALSNDGKILASASHVGDLQLSTITRKNNALSVSTRRIVQPHTEQLSINFALSPSGKLLAEGSQHGKTTQLWDTTTGSLITVLNNDPFVVSLAFNSDESLLGIATSNLLEDTMDLQLFDINPTSPTNKTAIYTLRSASDDTSFPGYPLALAFNKNELWMAGNQQTLDDEGHFHEDLYLSDFTPILTMKDYLENELNDRQKTLLWALDHAFINKQQVTLGAESIAIFNTLNSFVQTVIKKHGLIAD